MAFEKGVVARFTRSANAKFDETGLTPEDRFRLDFEGVRSGSDLIDCSPRSTFEFGPLRLKRRGFDVALPEVKL